MLLLADSSVWHRSDHPDVIRQWREHLGDDRIATCGPLRLEILHSGRSADDYARMSEELDGLHQLPVDDRVISRALEVQASLARRGGRHHRVAKLIDLIVAATAERADAIVWHYDADYEAIAEVTGQPIRWAAPRGSL